MCGKPLTNKENHMKDGSIILDDKQRVSTVTYLPTAHLPPVANPARRGRLPNGVTSIRARSAVTLPAPAASMAEDPIVSMRRMLLSMQASLDFAASMLAEHERGQLQAT